MTKPTQRSVRLWMLGVMNRQRSFVGDNSDKDADVAVKSSIFAFVERFPAAAFSATSMEAVCASEAYWNEAKIIAALDAWWRANSPETTTVLPPEAEQAPVSSEAKQWLAMWYRANEDETATRALDLIRSHSHEAFEYLMRVDFRASSIAVLRRWTTPTATDLASEWDDPAGIERLFQKARAGMRSYGGAMGVMALGMAYASLVTAVRIHAPQHLWIVDPKRLREVDEPHTGPIVPAQPLVIAAPTQGLFD